VFSIRHAPVGLGYTGRRLPSKMIMLRILPEWRGQLRYFGAITLELAAARWLRIQAPGGADRRTRPVPDKQNPSAEAILGVRHKNFLTLNAHLIRAIARRWRL